MSSGLAPERTGRWGGGGPGPQPGPRPGEGGAGWGGNGSAEANSFFLHKFFLYFFSTFFQKPSSAFRSWSPSKTIGTGSTRGHKAPLTAGGAGAAATVGVGRRREEGAPRRGLRGSLEGPGGWEGALGRPGTPALGSAWFLALRTELHAACRRPALLGPLWLERMWPGCCGRGLGGHPCLCQSVSPVSMPGGDGTACWEVCSHRTLGPSGKWAGPRLVLSVPCRRCHLGSRGLGAGAHTRTQWSSLRVWWKGLLEAECQGLGGSSAFLDTESLALCAPQSQL